MSMNINDMKEAIISKMNKEAESATVANKKFGDAILEYICENMDVQYGWSASNPSSGAKDPVTLFKVTVSGQTTLTPSASFDLMLIKLAGLLRGLTLTPPSGFSLSPLSFNPAGVITATMSAETDQASAIENFCTQLIASLGASFKNSVSASGSHGAFVGATTGMVIT